MFYSIKYKTNELKTTKSDVYSIKYRTNQLKTNKSDLLFNKVQNKPNKNYQKGCFIQ